MREAVLAAHPATAPHVTHATKRAQPGALVVDTVTGQHAKVLHVETKHVHAATAGK